MKKQTVHRQMYSQTRVIIECFCLVINLLGIHLPDNVVILFFSVERHNLVNLDYLSI